MRLFAIALLLPFGLAGQSAKRLDKNTVRLERSEDGYEAILLFHPPRGIINLRIESQPESRGHALPMAKRLELWKPLLDQTFREHAGVESYLMTVGEYPELGERIAVAAACSGKWNPKTGQPHNGNPTTALKTLLGDRSLYRELDTFFDAMGYRTSINSAEQVVLCHWKELRTDGLDPACRAKMRPESVAPCGASLVFRLVNKEIP